MNKIEHSAAFRFRRVANWLPLGLAYAFFYMGRYNLTVAKNSLGELMSKEDFGTIFGIGAVIYGLAGFINGPITDRLGGRKVMLLAAVGAIAANMLMGLALYGIIHWQWDLPITPTFAVLYSINMYFQNFGAMALVTTKAPWFHVSERGTFSTIFGVMISLGIYFAFDWNGAILKAYPGQTYYVFFAPACILAVLWFVLFALLRNSPAEAGFENFPTGEAAIDHGGVRRSVFWVAWKILSHPVLLFVIGIEFCSGVMRNGVMHWYPIFAKETGVSKDFFVQENWGLLLCVAGIMGGILTGWASDKFFNSRRAPMAGILYALMAIAAGIMIFSLNAYAYLGGAAIAISLAVIGVHGIMSGTATMDFGGARNTGTAVGIVDGFVYFGTAAQSFVMGQTLPAGGAQKSPEYWSSWPLFLMVIALIGFALSLRIWNARPEPKGH